MGNTAEPPKSASLPTVPPGDPEPAWAVATLFPSQGCWSERDYLELPTNRHVEFSDGYIEVLPVPTRLHQKIVAFVYKALEAFVAARKLGEVYFAPLPVHLWSGKYREPDVIFVRAGNSAALEGDYLEGADLVVEVVSEDDPDRDWIHKRAEYERAAIPEYWIVDPSKGCIAVFTLRDGRYVPFGEYSRSERAISALLPEFSVSVSDTLAGA